MAIYLKRYTPPRDLYSMTRPLKETGRLRNGHPTPLHQSQNMYSFPSPRRELRVPARQKSAGSRQPPTRRARAQATTRGGGA